MPTPRKALQCERDEDVFPEKAFYFTGGIDQVRERARAGD